MRVEFMLNGERRAVDAVENTPLLWVLRDDLELTGTKFGCGRALCGACTVHVDGRATRACAFPIQLAAGKTIRTIEGLESDPVGRAVVDAWIRLDVVQCGWCQPGQCMSAAVLLNEHRARGAEALDAAIDAGMSGNLCRCGTYPRIRAAIHAAQQDLQAGPR